MPGSRWPGGVRVEKEHSLQDMIAGWIAGLLSVKCQQKARILNTGKASSITQTAAEALWKCSHREGTDSQS
eukprot:1146458-Pelagomonas_calceolata.AAC.6